MIRLARQADLILTVEGFASLALMRLAEAISHNSCEWRFRSVRGYTPGRLTPNPMSLGVEFQCGSHLDTIYLPAPCEDLDWRIYGCANAPAILNALAAVIRRFPNDPRCRALLLDVLTPLEWSDAE